MSKPSAKKAARQKRKQTEQHLKQQHRAGATRTPSSQPIPPTFDAERLNVPAGLYGGFGRIVAKLFRLHG
jgi:hypothetical protein